MHVAIDASPLGAGQGGDETYLRGLLGALADALEPGEGHHFDLHVRTGEPVPREIASHPDFAVRRLPAVSTALRLARSLPSQLRSLTPRPDVLYATVHAPLRSPVPVALQIHDLSFLHHPELYTAGTRYRLRALIGRQVHQASIVCTISEYSRQDIIESYGIEAERVHVIPPTLPEADHHQGGHAAGELDRWLGQIGVRGPYVLSVGNLHPRKNVARLIEAFVVARTRSCGLGDHQLVVCGGRRWGDDAEGRAAALAPPGSVIFTGRVADVQRDHLLRRATVLGYPSLFEGFGLPPLEAMAVGVPVLASNRGAIPEVVGDGALLVDPTDVEAMAGGLERLCGEGRLRSDLACRGFERVRWFGPARTASAALHAFRAASEMQSAPPRPLRRRPPAVST